MAWVDTFLDHTLEWAQTGQVMKPWKPTAFDAVASDQYVAALGGIGLTIVIVVWLRRLLRRV